MEFCRGLWDADESQLDAMAELYQRAHALIMGRVACEVMSGNFAPAAPRPTTRGGPTSSTPRPRWCSPAR